MKTSYHGLLAPGLIELIWADTSKVGVAREDREDPAAEGHPNEPALQRGANGTAQGAPLASDEIQSVTVP